MPGYRGIAFLARLVLGTGAYPRVSMHRIAALEEAGIWGTRHPIPLQVFLRATPHPHHTELLLQTATKAPHAQVSQQGTRNPVRRGMICLF